MSASINQESVALALAAFRAGLSIKEAAEAAGVSRATLYNWRESLPEVMAAWPTVTGVAAANAELERIEAIGLNTLTTIARDDMAMDAARVSAAKALVTYVEKARQSRAVRQVPEPAKPKPILKLLTAADAESALAL